MDSRAKISASGLVRIEGDRHSLFVVVVYQEHFDVVEKKSLSYSNENYPCKSNSQCKQPAQIAKCSTP
jgi:hypothetical protein